MVNNVGPPSESPCTNIMMDTVHHLQYISNATSFTIQIRFCLVVRSGSFLRTQVKMIVSLPRTINIDAC
jgi:hypothetical protein